MTGAPEDRERRYDLVDAEIAEAVKRLPGMLHRAELTPANLKGHLDVLCDCAALGMEEGEARKVAEARVALWHFISGAQKLAEVLDALPTVREPVPPLENISDQERRLWKQMASMNLPFLRAQAAVLAFHRFLNSTNLASDRALWPLVLALAETARGQPARLFKHPSPLRFRPVDETLRILRPKAVGIVEARLRAQALRASGQKKSRNAICGLVASCFAGYRTPSTKGGKVTRETVAAWHRAYSPVLQPGADLSASKRPIAPGVEAECWRALAHNLNMPVLVMPTTGAKGEWNPHDPDELVALADAWTEQLKADVEVQREIERTIAPQRRRASRRKREVQKT